MFIRIVWHRHTQAPVLAGNLRPLAGIPRRASDDLEIVPRDFDKMTQGLFDRQS